MIPYIIMMVAPLAGYILPVGNKEKKRRLSISIFFMILLLLMMVRSDTMGTDIVSYKFYFESYRNYSLINLLEMSDFFSSDIEPLFLIFNWIIARFTSNFRIYMMVVAAVSIIPIWRWYQKNIKMPELSLALFIAFEPLVMYVSGIRQGIAMAFVPFVYHAVMERKKGRFIVLIILASLIHFSALAMVLMYPIYHMRISRKGIFLLTGMFIVIYLLKNRLYQLVLNVVCNYIPKLRKYTSVPTETGAFLFLLFILLMLLYCYTIPNEGNLDKEDIGMRNFLVLSFIIQIFSSVSFLIMRFNYYYLMFVPLLIPSISNKAHINKRLANLLIKWITIGLILLFFLKAITHRGSTGQYVPYKFMWGD